MTERRHDGPSLTLLAGLFIIVLFGGVAIGVALGGMLPLPYGSVAAVRHYVLTQPVALHVLAVTVFGSSLPLAMYSAAVGARMRRLGLEGATPAIAVTAGALAAGALGLTGLLGATLTLPEVAADAALVRALYFLAFGVGGIGHVVALGVLIAAVARAGLLPPTLTRVGIAIAAVCECALLVLVWTALGPVLPVARVAAMVWLLWAGTRLPTSRIDSPAAS
jgi:hypothetical protein